MKNEQRLLAMRTLAKDYLEQPVSFIKEVVPRRLSTELDAWLPKRRFIDPAIFINRVICDLDACAFGEGVAVGEVPRRFNFLFPQIQNRGMTQGEFVRIYIVRKEYLLL